MIPDLSSLVTKKGATVGIPSTIVILLFAIMSNGGEYFPSNPVDDIKDNDKDLEEIKHQQAIMKKKLNKLINAICPHPDFTCMDR